jgi:hypothetical protein
MMHEGEMRQGDLTFSLRISSLGMVDDDTDCDGNAILKFAVSVSEFKVGNKSQRTAQQTKKQKRLSSIVESERVMRLSVGCCGVGRL